MVCVSVVGGGINYLKNTSQALTFRAKSLLRDKAHFHSGKFSAERKFCNMCLPDTNFPSGKNFEVENFQQ
jgi:hypothetical protein